MGKNTSSTPRVVGDQALEAVQPGPRCVSATPVSRRLDVLLLHDLPGHFSYRAIHDVVKLYGDVVRIRQIYDDDCPANRYYVTFATAAEARTVLDAVDMFDILGLRAEVLSSGNVAESDSDYVPNIFERAAEEASSEVRRHLRWFGGSLPTIATAGEIISAHPCFSNRSSAPFPGRTSAVTGRGS